MIHRGRLLAGAAVGITANVMDRVHRHFVNSSVDCIVIDSAHGHSKNIITTLKEIKSAFHLYLLCDFYSFRCTYLTILFLRFYQAMFPF